jgi:hypothetical protein
MKTTKHQILKSKEGFASQCRIHEAFTTKTALRNELQRLNDSWSRNGGEIVKFNKKDMLLVVRESDNSATYTFEYLERYI